MLEFEIGITQEELAGVFASQEPNDVAFAKTLELAVGGWREGKASLHLNVMVAMNNSGAVLIDAGEWMRRLQPSDN